MDEIKNRIDEWTKPPFDKDTIDEIKALVKNGDNNELKERFYAQLEFGTGGLRGIIGAGTNRMNIYTVGMTSQGLVNYILKNVPDKKSLVIARDSRRMSEDFARETASICAGNGITAYYFRDITPTPFASFAIRELGAVSGVVITASHNPPEYNGYKVYWKDGGQIIFPQDKEIVAEVGGIQSINEIKKMPFDEGIKRGLIKIIDEEITLSYIRSLEKAAYRKPGKSDIKIIYTPLHGTGYKLVPRILRHFGFDKVMPVEKQSIPDGNFPTVKSPNPEEKEALTMALELGERENADIILATDPDSDRMGVGFRDRNGKFILINGNQIGTMLEYYLLTIAKEKGRLPANGAVIKTIVTTDLQMKIAQGFQCRIIDVLTGFKWIASRIKKFDETGEHTFIFGGEESYGYLPVSFVRDKDAVSSCYFFSEMAAWLKERGQTLYDLLMEIYLKFGLYTEDLHSLTLKGLDGLEKIKRIMEYFRNNPPADFAGRTVESVSDMQTLKRKNIQTGKTSGIEDIEKSDVIQFFLTDGSKITARPSGTEPKIKFYFSVNDDIAGRDMGEVQINQKKRIEELKKSLLEKIDSVG